MITDKDMQHLRRCVELAAEALEAGDEPFGSVLVDADGNMMREDRNRANTFDANGSGAACDHSPKLRGQFAAKTHLNHLRPDASSV